MTPDVAAVLVAYVLPVAAVTAFAFLWRWMLRWAARERKGRG